MLRTAVLVATALVVLSTSARAAVIINVVQSGSNVVATLLGSANLNGLTQAGAAGWAGRVSNTNFAVGPSSSVKFYTGITGPSTIATGNPSGVMATSNTGDFFGVVSGQGLHIFDTYVSGGNLSGTSTWSNNTFSGLGLTPGVYQWTWGAGPNADSLTLNIGQDSGIPEPATVSLFGLGLGAVLIARARRCGR